MRIVSIGIAALVVASACSETTPTVPAATRETPRSGPSLATLQASSSMFPPPVATPGAVTQTYPVGPGYRIDTPYMFDLGGPSRIQSWFAQADGSGSLTVTLVAGLEANGCGCASGSWSPPLFPGTFTVTVFDGATPLTSFTLAMPASSPPASYQSATIPATGGVTYRVQVQFSAFANPILYRLKFDGARDVSMGSDGNSTNAVAPVGAMSHGNRWVMNVGPGEALDFRVVGENFAGSLQPVTGWSVEVFDPLHDLVQTLTAVDPAGQEFVFPNAGDTPGPWVVRVAATPAAQGQSPYRLFKNAGADRLLHVNWYTTGGGQAIQLLIHAPPGVDNAHLALTADDFVSDIESSGPAAPGGAELPTNALLGNTYEHGFLQDGQGHFTITPSTAAPVPAGWTVRQGSHIDFPITADATTRLEVQIQVAPSIAVTGGTFVYDGAPHAATAVATNLVGGVITNGTFDFSYDPGPSAPVNAGTYSATAAFTSDDPNYTSGTGTGTIVITAASSVTTLTCPATAAYTGTAVTPCTATVTGAGGFSQAVPVTYAGNDAPGDATATATFPGDGNHTGSSASASFLVFAYPAGGGSFVVGDGAVANASQTFWDAQWSQANPLAAGDAPSSFKGFADRFAPIATMPRCGGTWSTDTGNSPPPPATVPAYMAVIVSGAVTQKGSTISGDIARIVVVKTQPGYAPGPGHTGTGTIVATICGR